MSALAEALVEAQAELPCALGKGSRPWRSKPLRDRLMAILAGALAAPPASILERQVARFFSPYHQAIDQGYGYRYYRNAGTRA